MPRVSMAMNDVHGREAVMQKSRRALTRTVAWGLVGGLVLLLSGDRGVRTDDDHGTDPLDILNLQIRANAIIVLDSSGSMGETIGTVAGDLGGDALDSKMFKAKQVLKTVIRDNERKVSFQFGQYKQPGVGSGIGVCSRTTSTTCTSDAQCPPATGPFPAETCVLGPMNLPLTGFGRFLYTTTSNAAPSMTSSELQVDLRSYVVPAGQRMRMREGGATLADTAQCGVAAGTYQTAFDFANAVATAMSNCGTGGNTYTVTVDQANSHRFRFTRVGTASWGIRWDLMTGAYDTLRQFLVAFSTDSGNLTGATYVPASTPTTSIDLKRDTSVGASNAGKFTEDGVTYYKMYARRFYNGQTIRVRPDGVACSVTPVPGTTGVGGDGSAAGQEPWVDLELGTTACGAGSGQVVRFKFGSVPRSGNFLGNGNADGEWRDWGNVPGRACGGFESLVPLQPCTQNSQFTLVSPLLDNELVIDPSSRWPRGYSENATGALVTQPQVGGMRAAGNTPIAQSLTDIDLMWQGPFPTPLPPNYPAQPLWTTISTAGGLNGPFPKSFVIFVTDGDDTCETALGNGCADGGDADAFPDACLTDDQRALRAAYRAQLLYAPVDSSNTARAFASSVTTFVVAFGSGVSGARADWVAYGGSGMVRGTTDNGNSVISPFPSIGRRWTSAPSQADIDACTTCRPAFVAGDEGELGDALQIAIDQGQSVGTFSDQQSVTDSIFELSFVAGFDPRNPQTRYQASVPVLLQSTFAMPDFAGRLKAFRRGVAASVEEWDSGVRLRSRVLNGVSGSDGVGATNWSYGELRGTGSDANIVSSNARIKRRIYTSGRNGVFQPTQSNLLNATGPGRVTLWPAEASVDPAGAGGTFDDELGITTFTATPLITTLFQALQAEFAACTASVAADLPANCLPAAGAAAREAHAKMESRRIILASMAGAELLKTGGLAVRRPADKQLLFRAKPWQLGESTLAAPAVLGPPPSEAPGLHGVEYDLFINGPRDGATAVNGISAGFGLRNPDKDSPTSQNDSRQALKPVMSVAYHAANDMLHAFRAGPCRNNSAGTTCLDGTDERGGEELWGFVPYDLLGNLRKLILPQSRANHVYMLSAPVRVTQVFVPGSWTTNIGGVPLSGEGLWRNVILFGRGIGGKYLTALDVTAPGPFTQGSLSTTGPIPLWNRGNPDTQDGLAGGTVNNNTDDATAYLEMGETWSVPAIAFVEKDRNVTQRKPEGVEFVAYSGSGYSAVATEGKRFYALDLLTGDVIASANVGNRPGNGPDDPFENVLVSGPVVFNEVTLSNRDLGVNPAQVVSTRVYFNDIHGRLFRIMTNDPATVTELADVNNSSDVLHPLGVPPALVFYGDPSGQEYPHIYIESGNDNRIFSPEAVPAVTPPFKAWALVDADDPSDPDGGDGVVGPVRVLFTKEFPNLYRGTTQPATAFNTGGQARVLFAGTRYNPPATQFAPPPAPPVNPVVCRSSFDSILFALGAGTGNAAFDLNATGQDEYIEYVNQQIKSVQVVGGQAIVDRGLNAEIAPTPPPSNTIAPPVVGSVFQGLSVPGGFVVSHRETPFAIGTAVCR